jgi:hypothetical protein
MASVAIEPVDGVLDARRAVENLTGLGDSNEEVRMAFNLRNRHFLKLLD